MTLTEQLDPLIQKLIDRLNADDPVTRRNAAGSLRLHGERAVGAIPELLKHMFDEDVRVRNEVRRALDRLRRAAAA
jgi:HEAT repeat protein